MGDEAAAWGVDAANSRRSIVRKFLAKVPRGAARLRMQAAAEGGQTTVQLGEWEAESIAPPTTAEDVCGLLDEHCAEMGTAIVAVLDWVDANGGRVGGAKVLKRAPQHLPTGDSLASMPEQLTGDSVSQAMQAQRHLEVMMRMQLNAMAGMFQMMRVNQEHLMELVQNLSERDRQQEGRVQRAEAEVEAMREAMAQAGSSEDAATVDAQNRIARVLEPVVALAVQRMMNGGKPPSAPPTQS